MEAREYYSRDVCSAIAEVARDREVAFVLPDGRYGTRPNVINYPRDVEAMVRDGAVSFHGSLERWRNPLELSTELPRSRMEEMRIGWDFIIDIDCNFGMEFAKRTACVFLKAIESFKIADCSIKFSGRRGFHIGVPFEVFPEEIDNAETRLLYPDLPKKIVEYLKHICADKLRKEIVRTDVPKPDKDIGEVDPYAFVEIDSGVFSSRHMFRLPYCLHQKTGLASVPLRAKDLEKFEPDMARPENVRFEERFLEREVVSDATELVRSALFHSEYIKKEEPVSEKREFAPVTSPVTEAAFPPCIKRISTGLSDGKKRSAFVLATFLMNIGWNEAAVAAYLRDWNKRNKDPLRDNFLALTLKSQSKRRKAQNPPNCSNESYYRNFGVCLPDSLCARIKNPLSYALARTRRMEKPQRGKGGKKAARPGAGKKQGAQGAEAGSEGGTGAQRTPGGAGSEQNTGAKKADAGAAEKEQGLGARRTADTPGGAGSEQRAGAGAAERAQKTGHHGGTSGPAQENAGTPEGRAANRG